VEMVEQTLKEILAEDQPEEARNEGSV
jgi:hypothetical protein